MCRLLLVRETSFVQNSCFVQMNLTSGNYLVMQHCLSIFQKPLFCTNAFHKSGSYATTLRNLFICAWSALQQTIIDRVIRLTKYLVFAKPSKLTRIECINSNSLLAGNHTQNSIVSSEMCRLLLAQETPFLQNSCFVQMNHKAGS